MEKIIKISGIEVSQLSCTIAFNVRVSYSGKNKNASPTDLNSRGCAQITHSMLYGMLEDASEIKEIEQTSSCTRFAELTMGGGITIEVYTMSE